MHTPQHDLGLLVQTFVLGCGRFSGSAPRSGQGAHALCESMAGSPGYAAPGVPLSTDSRPHEHLVACMWCIERLQSQVLINCPDIHLGLLRLLPIRFLAEAWRMSIGAPRVDEDRVIISTSQLLFRDSH